MPVVATVFFHARDYCAEIENIEEGHVTAFGLPVWRPKKRPVMVWAIDFVVAGDEQFIVFGPFADASIATIAVMEAFKDDQNFAGYRIENEHCWVHTFSKKRTAKYPYHVYTDG